MAKLTKISTKRLNQAYHYLEGLVGTGRIPGASILVADNGIPIEARSFGNMSLLPDSQQVQPDTIFLVASVTKPVTAAAVMLLVERGKLLLDDPVYSIIPEFANRGKEVITVRHLMTHTSGLPDMLPENTQLREKHAPLKEFIRRICDLELDFPAGTSIQYQSCGIAILGEIVERITGSSLPEFLRSEIFSPLGMHDTSLGIGVLQTDRVAHVNIGEEMQKVDWGWNKSYWRNFGAPWGGMFSTVNDMFRFCQAFINGGEFDGIRVFSLATTKAMTSDQTTLMPNIPSEIKSGRVWGLGWRLQPTADWSAFGDLVSPGAFGHYGATGTVVWADPLSRAVCILFTTQPSASSEGILGRCSNMVAASIT